MTLEELLSELRENILGDRSDRIDGDSDRLWSDATLVRYIEEAQRRFARRSLILRDSRTEDVVQVTLETGVTEYVLHSSVLMVVSAKLEGESYDLPRTGHSSLDEYRSPDLQFFDASQLTILAPGKPLAYTTDETLAESDDTSFGSVVLRVYPAPSATYNGDKILLRVARLPIERLTAENLEAVPELPEIHHLEMLDWAAYLALRIVDVDAGFPTRAREFADSFEAHVAAAKATVKRKLLAPVRWGFGQGGYSWER